MWKEIGDQIASIPESEDETPSTRPEEQILEELVTRIRTMGEQIGGMRRELDRALVPKMLGDPPRRATLEGGLSQYSEIHTAYRDLVDACRSLREHHPQMFRPAAQLSRAAAASNAGDMLSRKLHAAVEDLLRTQLDLEASGKLEAEENLIEDLLEARAALSEFRRLSGYRALEVNEASDR